MTLSERCQVVRLEPPSWRAVRRSASRRASFILRKRLCHALATAYGMVTTRLSGRTQPSLSSVRANFSTARLTVSMFKCRYHHLTAFNGADKKTPTSKPFRACIETAPTRNKLTQRLIQVLVLYGVPQHS